MARLIVVAGTGTEIGKTWLTARLAGLLRADGRKVAVRKPVQSFEPGAGPTDAEVLAEASGEAVDQVSPPHRSYPVAMAPFMAAERVGASPFTLDDLVAELRWPDDADVVLVEPAGGVRSPMTADGGDTVDLCRAVGPDLVVLVADAGLGTINAVRLAVEALAGFSVIVFLNRFDGGDLHEANRRWLAGNTASVVATRPEELLALL
jgi:dethiobiotin synthetase